MGTEDCGEFTGKGRSLKLQKRVFNKSYACKDCGKMYKNLFSLKSHILMHAGEKPHLCGVCEHGFRQSSALKIHMQTHMGEKSHACDIYMGSALVHVGI